MKRIAFIFLSLLMTLTCFSQKPFQPWKHGKLMVSEENRYIKCADGTPFFWLGDTGWLLPERLNRDEAEYYLDKCHNAGYNVVQVQTIDAVPAYNIYGQPSMTDGYNFKDIDRKGVYGYWNHLDFIIKAAERNGIYIAMTCIWGSQVKSGAINVEQAKAYGTFLANRYKNSPNIIWIIGGDVPGNENTEVWEALAKSIKAIDKNHLMTYHPRGRMLSTEWFNKESWLDFNMFQSGHRRYGQRRADETTYQIPDSTEEDNWQYVERSLSMTPMKPVLDGEPSYEDIPQGLHDPLQPHWLDRDCRRYAYWSVFAGSFGHTYGHNSIMQMMKPGVGSSYGKCKPWYDALNDPGYNQMKYIKNLMLTFPFFERIPDQSIIVGKNGIRHDRVSATRGKDYMLVYNYSGRPMQLDLSKISGNKKLAWWYSPKTGALQYIGEFENKVVPFTYNASYMGGTDAVLIAMDASKNYVHKDWTELPEVIQK